MTEPIRRIVVAGGGTAGWMAAALLVRQLRGMNITVTLVESEAIGTVGVGEATIPPLQHFNKMLGVAEADFVKATQGSFKLGIEFVDWWRTGQRYFHPFGRYGGEFGLVPFHQQWLAARARGETGETLDDYSLAQAAARMGRFTASTEGPIFETYGYAYHFDAGLYARFLRGYAESRGVVRVEGRIGGVALDPETGFVTHLTMEDGRQVEGDLFIDCTGFRALLIGETLGVPYLDWRRWLPCDRAVAMPCERIDPVTPFTRSTAREAGWQWRIPLQHRTGNGYVYCSEFLDADGAEARLAGSLDGAALGQPNHLRFTGGRREVAWSRNVVSTGLASGFIEPLESTSIHFIQSSIVRLLRNFPGRDFNPRVRDQYNQAIAREFERVRDFLVLHYCATQRDDTPFWRHCAAIELPDTLAETIELFRETGRINVREDDIFHEPSWLAVFLGQGVVPQGRDTLADAVPPDERADILRAMRKSIADAAAAMPTHDRTIADHFRAAGA